MLSKKYTTVTPFSRFLALALFVILPFLGFYLGMRYQKELEIKNYDVASFPKAYAPSSKACTMEAKICPDGSSVGRVGPNCEFAKCSQEK